jgi:hypothetical protein
MPLVTRGSSRDGTRQGPSELRDTLEFILTAQPQPQPAKVAKGADLCQYMPICCRPYFFPGAWSKCEPPRAALHPQRTIAEKLAGAGHGL